MTSPFRIQAYAKANRLETVASVRDILLSADAAITDYQQFSNASVCLTVEIAFSHLPDLYSALSVIPVSLTPELGQLLAGIQVEAPVPPSALVSGTLAISFLHDEPDLRLIVPAVPG